MFASAHAAAEAALAQARVEHAASLARVARLKHALALEQAGDREAAKAILADVRAEQEAETR